MMSALVFMWYTPDGLCFTNREDAILYLRNKLEKKYKKLLTAEELKQADITEQDLRITAARIIKGEISFDVARI